MGKSSGAIVEGIAGGRTATVAMLKSAWCLYGRAMCYNRAET